MSDCCSIPNAALSEAIVHIGASTSKIGAWATLKLLHLYVDCPGILLVSLIISGKLQNKGRKWRKTCGTPPGARRLPVKAGSRTTVDWGLRCVSDKGLRLRLNGVHGV